MENNNRRIAFLHGRPSGHPLHAAYAESINADFYHEDRYLRWHDIPSALRIKRYLSWIVNGFLFPTQDYDIIMTECIRIPALVMKKLGVLRSPKKLVALMGDESLYFLSIKHYPRYTELLMKSFLNNCDYLLCTSKFQADLAQSIISSSRVKIITTFNGISFDVGGNNKAELKGNKILFMGNIESEWRVWYKGLDLAIEAFELLGKSNSKLEFYIVGEISNQVKKHLESLLTNEDTLRNIFFLGHSKNLLSEIKNYDLVLHVARGEAWGLTIHLAMAAGVPVIISEATGIKELVEKVSKKLIISLDKNEIIKSVNWYFSLTNREKLLLGESCKLIAEEYSIEKAITNFRKEFSQISL